MHRITAENKFTFKIEPDDQGGTTKTVVINRHNIAEPPVPGQKNTRKKAAKAHLLIGFDTEYQSVKDRELESTIEKGAKNDLLSYQFSIKLFALDNPDPHPEAEGIIIPQCDERLTMEQFIGIAIGSLIEKFPNITLPNSTYLIGHFIRADLPAFSDFKDQAHQRMNNIRSTFVTLNNPIPIKFRDGEEDIAEFKVSIRDTILLSPANAKSLADIGEIVGFPKIQLGQTPEEDKDIKQNMARFRADHWLDFRKYGIRDAQVCVHYAQRIIEQSYSLFGEFKMAVTLTSFGSKLLIEGWKKAELDMLAVLGREKITEKKFSKKLGHFEVKTKQPYIEEVYYEEAFITESYHGGRNEQFIFGVADEGMWRDHDLSSAYTTAMSLIGLPKWELIHHINSLDDVALGDLVFASVDFEFPEHVRYPTLPVRTANGIVFPRKGHSKCAAPELFLAKELDAKLLFRRGVRVPFNPEIKVFQGFIQTCIQNRSDHPKGTFDNLFWKEIGNSTYGKTAQGLREKRVYNLNADDMESLPESKITQAYFASFITSYTRAVLGEMLNAFSKDVQVFSVTTDGFLSNANDDQLTRATSGPLFQSFSTARASLDQKSDPLEVKHIVKRPIGWRTRGSATLVQGVGKNNIVLQKGGLKTKVFNDLEEENREVIGLFLNRTPNQKMHYTSGVGIKDMLRNDTDFVFKSVHKRLSMEFDWKRIPVNVREVQIDFEGQAYSHLTFETDPVETVTGFNHVRDDWDRYNKKGFHNLKSSSDYDDFQNFRITQNVPHSTRAWMKRKDGDIQRLKRDVCRAFKRQQAGFEIIRANQRIMHGQVCQALNACGVPCRISDFDNAKKKEFQPHQTPPTTKVIAALTKLKEDYYPELEIGLFLSEEAMDQTEKSPMLLAA